MYIFSLNFFLKKIFLSLSTRFFFLSELVSLNLSPVSFFLLSFSPCTSLLFFSFLHFLFSLHFVILSYLSLSLSLSLFLSSFAFFLFSFYISLNLSLSLGLVGNCGLMGVCNRSGSGWGSSARLLKKMPSGQFFITMTAQSFVLNFPFLRYPTLFFSLSLFVLYPFLILPFFLFPLFCSRGFTKFPWPTSLSPKSQRLTLILGLSLGQIT